MSIISRNLSGTTG